MSASSKKKLRKEQEAALLTEKQLTEQKEAKKLKTYTIVFVIVMALVLAIFAYSVVSKAISNAGLPQKLTTALEIGDHDIKVNELSYYYHDSISEYYNGFYQYYGSQTGAFLLMMGLDVSKPLDEQYMDVDGKITWGEYFANMGVDKAKEVYALVDAANAEGFTLSDASKASIESDLNMLRVYAPLYGYTDLESYLKSTYGNGASEKTFRKYLEDGTLAQDFLNDYTEKLSYGDADYREYEKEHFDEYSNFSYRLFTMSNSAFYQGGTKNEDGTTTYSDEEKAAAAKAAAEAADSIKKGTYNSSDELDNAIAALSAYAGDSSAKTTLNSDISYSQINTTVRTWLCEDGRKVGDVGVLPITSTTTDADGKEVTNTTGYYLVVFEGRDDNTFKLKNVRHILVEFEGGTVNSTTGETEYTEAEKLATKKKAEDILAKFNETGKTEDDFAALVKDNTADAGSVDNGGLYEDIYPGQMVANFETWCYYEGRKVGETGIVESPYGYHVMYFVGDSDITYRDYMIDNTLTSEDQTQWLNGLVEDLKIGKIDISKLNLGYIMAPSTSY